MNICNRCTRVFHHKNSLHRHIKKRRYPCTPPVIDCVECGKSFSSIHSLKKHEKLYCKHRRRLPPLEDYLSQKGIVRDLSPPPSPLQWTSSQSLNFNSNTSKDGVLRTPVYTAFTSKLDDVAEQRNPFFSDSLQALFDTIKCSPPAAVDADNVQLPPPPPQSPLPAAPANESKEILNHLDDILSCWLGEVQRLEGTYNSDFTIKKDIHTILLRMLQDGVLSEQDYNSLIFTSNVFIRLHDIIGMYIPMIHKREVIGLLITLYDMRRISEEVFTEIYIKL